MTEGNSWLRSTRSNTKRRLQTWSVYWRIDISQIVHNLYKKIITISSWIWTLIIHQTFCLRGSLRQLNVFRWGLRSMLKGYTAESNITELLSKTLIWINLLGIILGYMPRMQLSSARAKKVGNDPDRSHENLIILKAAITIYRINLHLKAQIP